ncbi:MAG: DUF1648 domain-containing protein [Micrococcus sp.]|nr:DUF1648 domain-containing protein [Micrococcus sp.]
MAREWDAAGHDGDESGDGREQRDGRERAETASERRVLARTRWRPWMPMVLAVAVTVGLLVWTAVALPGLPEEVPVHWGADGQPTRYEPTSFFSVTQGLLIAMPMLILVTAVVPLAAQLSGSGGQTSWQRVRKVGVSRGLTAAMGWVSLAVVLLVSVPMMEVLTGATGQMPWWVMPLAVTLLLVGMLPLMSLALRRWMRWAEDTATELGYRPSQEEAADDRLWTPMGLKNDPDDPQVFVNKREGYGVGATINIGSRGGRMLYRGFIAVFMLGIPLLLWIAAAAAR